MAPRILIAGIGNIFFGDDAFGVEVAHRLLDISLPDNVKVVDFGIRGFDLAYALTDGYNNAILVDATARGQLPGTLYLIEPNLQELEKAEPGTTIQTHGLHPALVLQLAAAVGELCPWIRIVGCEPFTLGSEEDPVMGLSDVVQASVAEAITMIQSLVETLCATPTQH